MKTFIAILLTLLGAIFLMTGALSCIKQRMPAAPTGLRIITPAFKVNQCFIHNETPRESWEPPADGIIAKVGYKHYLVIEYKEAERRSVDKTAMAVPIEEFDKEYHEVVCPEEWLNHSRNNNKEAV